MNFDKFPKERIPLPEKYQEIFEEHYQENRSGKSKMSFISSKLEEWLHKQVAKSSNKHKDTLEIGAGTLNQLRYEKTGNYDIVEPFELLYKDSASLNKIRNIYVDIKEVPMSQKYHRITAIASLEHILNLPDVVAAACKLLDDSTGVFCVAITNEGRFLWKFAYTVSTGLEFKRKYGLDYSLLMNYEHVNTADEIEEVLKYFFKETKMKLFGICKTLALYRYYECSSPKVNNVNKYINKYLM